MVGFTTYDNQSGCIAAAGGPSLRGVPSAYCLTPSPASRYRPPACLSISTCDRRFSKKRKRRSSFICEKFIAHTPTHTPELIFAVLKACV